jgi:exopolysaccharide/PEP-CTERM locus tyrosine autokinase
MSRIEQALEKAAHLRTTTSSAVKTKEPGNASVQAIRQHTLLPPMDGAEFKTHIENPLLATLCDPHSPVSEEYRKLKSVVSAFAQQGKFKNVIMVTSSVSGEGKSITSLNLAITLAQEFDHTVLLVDADLRKPSLEGYLGMNTGKGLSDYLSGKAVLSELLIKSGIGRLTLLPGGSPLRNPVELFSSQKMRDFILEIKNRYPDRFIIIDTPPTLPFAETRSLSALVDGVLFVIREGSVTPENILEAMNTFDSEKLIGTVYNDATKASLNGHYHYYGYGYGYSGQEMGISHKRQETGSFLSRLLRR